MTAFKKLKGTLNPTKLIDLLNAWKTYSELSAASNENSIERQGDLDARRAGFEDLEELEHYWKGFLEGPDIRVAKEIGRLYDVGGNTDEMVEIVNTFVEENQGKFTGMQTFAEALTKYVAEHLKD